MSLHSQLTSRDFARRPENNSEIKTYALMYEITSINSWSNSFFDSLFTTKMISINLNIWMIDYREFISIFLESEVYRSLIAPIY